MSPQGSASPLKTALTEGATRRWLKSVAGSWIGLREAVVSRVLGRSRLGRKEAAWAYLFTLPWLIGFLLLRVMPFIVSAVMSLYQWRGQRTPRYVGLGNYEWILTKDALFRKALQVTGSYALLAVPLAPSLSIRLS